MTLSKGKHEIPFNIQPEWRAEIREVRLYLSTDRGGTWRLHDSASPDKNRFVFDAPRAGVYWFRVAAVDQKGKQEPEDITKTSAAATIKIFIARAMRGIYKLDGDRLTICYTGPDTPRPAEFRTGPESKAQMIVLERQRSK